MKHFTCLFLVLICIGFYSNLYSEMTDEEIKTQLPSLLNLNNESKEYWFTIPPCFEDESQYFQNFIKIFVTSQHKTPVTVSVAATGYNVTKTTIPNDVIEFNILPHDGQPFTKSGWDPNIPEQVFKGKGIHVYSEFPIIVYVVVRYKYTSDGFLAIPVASLGKEYIVAGSKVDAMFRAIKKLASTPEELNFGRHKAGNNNILMQATFSNISDDTVTINANDLIFKNSYFELTSASQFPITLKPKDNLTVMVKPKLLPNGSYIDTLVFNGGLFKNVMVLLARITYLVPQIEVAGLLDFGQKSIYDNFISYKTLLVKNSSEFDEKIFRFDLPSDNAFSTLISNSDQYGNLNEPYLLMPSAVFDYQVGFKPTEVRTYFDSITVYTESYPNGLKTIIKGEGVLVNSVDNQEEPFVSAYYSIQILTVIAENIESVSIFDLTGRIVYESGNIFQLNIINIDNLNLSTGLYLVKIKSKGINYYRKVLVL